MATRPALLMRRAAAVGACVLLLADCRTPGSGGDARTLASGADSYKGFVSLFTKIIGRKPQGGAAGQPGDFALYDPDPDLTVDKLLASAQFRSEGFYNVHADRLVLTPYQQAPAWLKTQHASYCALRRELAEVADQDLRTAAGYWSILSYQDRWLPLPPDLTGCFLGASVAELKAAFGVHEEAAASLGGPGGASPIATPSGGFTATAGATSPLPAGVPGVSPTSPVRASVPGVSPTSLLPAGVPGVGPIGAATPPAAPASALAAACAQGPSLRQADRSQFVAALRAVGPDRQAQAFIDTPEGLAELAAALTALISPADAAGAAAAAVNVTLPATVGSRPQVAEEFDPAQESTACSFRDLPDQAAAWVPTPTSTVLVRARVSPKAVGVMANPFWLARHPTNDKNRGLHRARVAMFSYFCKEVSPAAADVVGGPAQLVAQLAPYFPPDDTHAQASQACYDCHTTMQPLANFYSAMDKNAEADSGLFGAHLSAGLRFFQKRGALELPGGYWTLSAPGAGAFFGTQGVDYDLKGLQGLANLLSDKRLPGPAQCVVTTAWASLFGSEYRMPDAVKAAALNAFEQGNAQGGPSLTEALRFLMKSTYGKAFFSPTQGRPAFEALLAGVAPLACPEATTATGLGVVKQRCYACHNAHHRSGGIAFLSNPERQPLPLTEAQRHKAFCAVTEDNMPADGALELADKQAALCYLHPVDEAAPACGDAPSPGPDAPIHPNAN